MAVVVAVADMTETPVDGTDLHAGHTIHHRHPTAMATCIAMQMAPRRTGLHIRLARPRTRNPRGNLILRLSLDLVGSVRTGGRLYRATEDTRTTNEVTLGAVLLEVARRGVVPTVVLPEAEVHQGVAPRRMVVLVMDNMAINLHPTGEGDIMADTPVPVEEATGVAVMDTAGTEVMATSQLMVATARTIVDYQVVVDMVVTPAAAAVVVGMAVPILPEAEVVVAGSVHVNLSTFTNGFHINMLHRAIFYKCTEMILQVLQSAMCGGFKRGLL